jgi:maleylacetate reductase
MTFVHETQAQRIRFAPAAAAEHLAEEVAELGAEHLMVISSAAEADLALRLTSGLPVAVHHHDVAMHVPDDVAARARQAARDHRVDALVCVGGGSTTGLAKVVALTSGLPIIAVPTTYAGSEATSVWGMTEAGRKTTGSDPRVLPRTVIYDASLLRTLPVDLSVASGLNAVAHCVDSMWAPRADPISSMFAAEGIRALTTGLPIIKTTPDDLEGIERTLLGAYLAAVAFSSAGSGLHHKICHVLGGMFDLPHAQTHAVVLPHVLALNAPAAPHAEHRMATAFGAQTATEGLTALDDVLGAPTSLRDLGMPERGIASATPEILSIAPPSNPVQLTEELLKALLRSAWEGRATS